MIPTAEWDKQEVPIRVGLVADHNRQVADPARFAGLRVDESIGRVDVWWAGGVPDVVAEYAGSEPLGISVALHPDARFPRAVAEQAVDVLLADRNRVKELGFSYTSIRYDGSGVDVGVLGDPPSSARIDELGRLIGLSDGLFFIGKSSPIVETTGTK
ncbi:unannotated protein [freshwater metagenome]|uniref:Unannotated protein n=1 Tax=freshwater metagenome TaxID=449393 RepID=A0A6J7R9F5_9ZZZZ